MARRIVMLALLSLVVACASDPDPDGDGLLSADEEALGTDPDLADTDGDGLDDGDEQVVGTDPLASDTDGDSWTDGDEIDGTTNPLNKFDWPVGEGRWPDFSADAAAIAGADSYGFSTPFPDFEYADAFGNDVRLHQFYGNVVLLDLSAGWCGPCQLVAEDANEMWHELRTDGFMIIHAMIDDWTADGVLNEPFLEEWSDEFGLEFPVLDAGDGVLSAELTEAGINEGGIPFVLLLDRELNLRRTFTGTSDAQDEMIRMRIDQLLDE